mmetsp:Transcript_102746/g.290922  ORF Transcript_102746/g.290922 Transcript_102746/m.290922 type:complete len:236 (+) Transcript_102746:194-901(+)
MHGLDVAADLEGVEIGVRREGDRERVLARDGVPDRHDLAQRAVGRGAARGLGATTGWRAAALKFGLHSLRHVAVAVQVGGFGASPKDFADALEPLPHFFPDLLQHEGRLRQFHRRQEFPAAYQFAVVYVYQPECLPGLVRRHPPLLHCELDELMHAERAAPVSINSVVGRREAPVLLDEPETDVLEQARWRHCGQPTRELVKRDRAGRVVWVADRQEDVPVLLLVVDPDLGEQHT